MDTQRILIKKQGSKYYLVTQTGESIYQSGFSDKTIAQQHLNILFPPNLWGTRPIENGVEIITS